MRRCILSRRACPALFFDLRGPAVTVSKDLQPKGSGGVFKQGAKVKSIRLVDADHDIDCRIEGLGAMSLKSGFVRKA